MKYRLMAEFEDGYKYLVNKKDESKFDSTRNGFYDILNELPLEHGSVKRLGLKKGKLSKPEVVVELPKGARPLYEVDRQATFTVEGDEIMKNKTVELAFRVGYILKGKKVFEEVI